MSIFKEFQSVSLKFEKTKFEKSAIVDASREVIDSNIIKFVPNKDEISLTLEIQNKDTKHTVSFGESGVSSLLKYLNKHLVPGKTIVESQDPVVESSKDDKKSSNTSKQAKKT